MHREDDQWRGGGTYCQARQSQRLPHSCEMLQGLQNPSSPPSYMRDGFSFRNAWWFGTGRATFSNKCPWSLTPSCKRQAVSVIIWWVKLRRDFCVFTFELAQSYISRNPLILYRLNSRGTTGSNTLNMAFWAQLCQVHLCFFPSFPGKEGKFCGWPPKNWRRQQVASEICPRLNLPDFFLPIIFCFVLFFISTFPLKSAVPPAPSLCSANPQEARILYSTKKHLWCKETRNCGVVPSRKVRSNLIITFFFSPKERTVGTQAEPWQRAVHFLAEANAIRFHTKKSPKGK